MAKRHALSLVVITPDRQVLEESPDYVVLPAHDGELGILPGRAPLMCELGIGQLRYRKGTEQSRVFIDGGFAQVLDDRVVVLSTAAMPRAEITPEVIADARRKAEAPAAVGPEGREARRRAQRRAAALRAVAS